MITKFYESINEHLNSIKSSEQAVHVHTMNEPHLSAISGTHLPRRAARCQNACMKLVPSDLSLDEKEIGFVIWGLDAFDVLDGLDGKKRAPPSAPPKFEK